MTNKVRIAGQQPGNVSIPYQTHRNRLHTAQSSLRRRIATEGWGATCLSHRNSDGLWGGAFHLPKSTRTLHPIAHLAVHPDYQGQGVSRALLTAGLQLAQAWGCSRALLNTQAANHRSQQLYRDFGFRPTGEAFAVFVLDLPTVRGADAEDAA